MISQMFKQNTTEKCPMGYSVTIYAQWLNDEASFGFFFISHSLNLCFSLQFFLIVLCMCMCLFIFLCTYCDFYCQSIFYSRAFCVQSKIYVVDRMLDNDLFCGLIQYFMAMARYLIFFYNFETTIYIYTFFLFYFRFKHNQIKYEAKSRQKKIMETFARNSLVKRNLKKYITHYSQSTFSVKFDL